MMGGFAHKPVFLNGSNAHILNRQLFIPIENKFAVANGGSG